MNRRVTSVLVALLLCAAVAGEAAYKRDQRITVGGRVIDGEGQPIAGVTVLFEASRRKAAGVKRLWKWGAKGEKRNTLRLPALAAADGSFGFEWLWDPYYDTFELAVALPVEESFELFLRRDVSESLLLGNPLTVTLEVTETGYLEWLRRFVAGQASDDEKETYRHLGRPDRIDRQQRLQGAETSWWYFTVGQVIRFVDGRRQRVENFEPVPPAE